MDLIVKAPRLPRLGESLAVNNFAMIPGGKGANQAVACARLGAQVSFMGRVGEDPFGEKIITSLHREGINLKYIRTDPEIGTGIGLVVLDQYGRNRIFISMGANAKCKVEDFGIIESLIPQFDVLLLQLEISLEVIKSTLDIAKQSNVLTILDPAPAFTISSKLFKKVDILVPNQIEAEFFSRQKVRSVQTAKLAAEKLIKLGPSAVVIKLSNKGTFLLTHEESIYIKAKKVDVVDTLGAGDAFVGAFAVNIAKGKDLRESLQYANYAGALTTTKFGAQPSVPTAKELERFISERR